MNTHCVRIYITMRHEHNETIAAISTPEGVGAIGVVRITGPDAKNVLSKIWQGVHNSVDKFETHRLYYGKIIKTDPSSTAYAQGVDNVLAVWMQAPHSYTGEDAVEIYCHGGPLTAKAVLEALIEAGAGMAGPGEFTRRAFLNGKMDLSQAEAVADLIGASSEKGLGLAREQLEGRLSQKVKAFQDELKRIKAFVEATIDFPEEDVEFIQHEDIAEKIEGIRRGIENLSLTYDEGRLIHDGVKTVIVGKPNVGKSSILNALLGIDRAIVHHEPGTTRDAIEETLQLGGVNFRLIDTAGIRESECDIERLGIQRTRLKLSEADLVIVVLDASRPVDAEDERILSETREFKRIVVLNKIDLEKFSKNNFPEGVEVVRTSTKNDQGMDRLKDNLINFVRTNTPAESEGAVITNLRHKRALDEAADALEKASAKAAAKESAEFVACHLQETMLSLGKITGEVTTEDVLNEIFSRFCIGK